MPNADDERLNVRFGYADTALGQLHYAACGDDSGTPVLLLHQTPRSWTEFADVIPLVGRSRRTIAMDSLGFGGSADPAEPLTIELLGSAVEALCDALGYERVHMVGHHTGGVIAIEAAARMGSRVASVLVSGAGFIDKAEWSRASRYAPVDWVPVRADGLHLKELWQRRAPFYGPGQEGFLTRFIVDAMRALDYVEDGHTAVHRYHMDERVGDVRSPVRAICGESDRYRKKDLEKFAAAFGCETKVIPGGGVSLPEEQPELFAREVLENVDRVERTERAS
jgi:pimeloyl-ACP methyl ester carboxylesterase